MAVKDTAPMGMRHLTVVPENVRLAEDETDDDRADLEHESRVPRHR